MNSQAAPKVLIIGANGQVGRALVKEFTAAGFLVLIATRLTDPAFDLSRPASLLRNLQAVMPDIVINAAAYTAVDKAESEPELAQTVNAESPSMIAAYCAAVEIPMIHYSTDYVFDGSNSVPYVEDDLTAPLNKYGQSKLAGEEAIRESSCNHFIFRTSWVYDHLGHNFLNTMLRLGSERDSLSIVKDQIGSPTWSGYLARETARVCRQIVKSEIIIPYGTYHLTCSEHTTWYHFADTIFNLAISQGILTHKPMLQPIASSDYPTPATRPKYSVLDTSKAIRNLGIQPMTWTDGLALCMRRKFESGLPSP